MAYFSMEDLLKAGWTQHQVDTLALYTDAIDSNEYEFQDNHRYARVGNKQETDAYYEQANTGCCGSYDVIIPCDGGDIMYGFNYGH